MEKLLRRLLKAIAFTSVMACGLSAQTFTEEAILATGLPVIKIDTENRADITSKDYYINIESFTVTDPANPGNNFTRRKSDAARPDRPADEIKGRGNATWAIPMWGLDYPKKPYRIRFTEQLKMLGLPEARNWVLLAEFRDPTFLYNSLAFELAKNILGMPFTHNYYHVHLYLNGDYRGLYGLTEQKQVHKNRINIDPDYGWFVNIDSYYDEEPKFETPSYRIPVMIKSPEPEGAENMSNPAYSFVREDWNRLDNLMSAGNFPESGYRDEIDLNSVVDYLMVNEITDNEELGNDQNVRSLLAYKDAGGKITMGPVWDFDCGFGYNYMSTHTYFTSYNQFIMKVPFLQRFYDDPVFRVRFRERWNEKYNQIKGITGYVDNVGQKISAAVAKDTERWLASGDNQPGGGFPGMGDNGNNGYVASQYITNHSEALNRLKSWLNSRIEWLNTEINSRYTGTIDIASAVVRRSNTSQVVVESYGKILTEGTHYTLSNTGGASVTVTGIGDYYSGSKTAEPSSVFSGKNTARGNTMPLVTIKGRTLNVNAAGVDSKMRIRVVNMTGKTIANFNASGNAKLSLKKIPAGSYIVEARRMRDGYRMTSAVVLR